MKNASTMTLNMICSMYLIPDPAKINVNETFPSELRDHKINN